ncbi:MAG: hypothetical protein AB9903_32055 [Vulcanimicrobiota bacterium]
MDEMGFTLDEESMRSQEINEPVKMDLKTYIKSLGEHLLCEPAYSKDALSEALTVISDDIGTIRASFTGNAPAGLEPVRDFMLESLNLYMQSVEDIRKYMSNEDSELLERAIVKAEEAEDIIGAVEDVIQEHKDWLSQMTEA